MEWVETTGKTIEEAKDLALDQLGVDNAEAEFEILDEPKSGLFGRTRGEARVRARIVPLTPPPKTDRRRKGSGRKGDSGSSGGGQRSEEKKSARTTPSDDAPAAAKPAEQKKPREPREPRGDRGARQNVERELMDADEQVSTLESFLSELVGSFGLEASVSATLEENELRANIAGDGLGYLVGPRLATLDAIQEVARHALQRQAAGREYAKVIVDIADVRERRREALSEFVRQAAERVQAEDVDVIFEVMSSADRKQVHDLVTTIDDVESASEGEDPRRRVVLRKA